MALMTTRENNPEPRPTLTCEMCGSPTGSPQHFLCQWCAQTFLDLEPWDFFREEEDCQ